MPTRKTYELDIFHFNFTCLFFFSEVWRRRNQIFVCPYAFRRLTGHVVFKQRESEYTVIPPSSIYCSFFSLTHDPH
jgi:hypothetical protein